MWWWFMGWVIKGCIIQVMGQQYFSCQWRIVPHSTTLMITSNHWNVVVGVTFGILWITTVEAGCKGGGQHCQLKISLALVTEWCVLSPCQWLWWRVFTCDQHWDNWVEFHSWLATQPLRKWEKSNKNATLSLSSSEHYSIQHWLDTDTVMFVTPVEKPIGRYFIFMVYFMDTAMLF